ncbi:MAG TPA: tetratricopeptide repeat protein [Azospirillaceae bacterium]|nr:tetratricopeptide repeat protein [Azospirillaceae bacterium]
MTREERLQAALAAHNAGRLDAAEAGYRAILQDDPSHAHANNNLAVLLRAGRRFEEAVACYRRALASLPDAPIYNNLACLYLDLGRAADAATSARTALALRPDYAEAWFNLGNVLRQAGDAAGAETAYRRALRLNAFMGEALCGLGDLRWQAHDTTEAARCYRRAIAAQPSLPQPFVNLGEMLKEQGLATEAIGVLQQGLEHHPDLALLHSNLLLALHYTTAVPPEIIARAHRHWGDRHASRVPAERRFANDRMPDRRLRVGYVSPDFRTHACAHFIEPLFQAHDREVLDIVCYATARWEDDTTARLRSLAGTWRSIADLDDAAAATLIRDDRIDILVDLAGHTANSRPLLFARKPAPVQVAWLGYPDTTGMAAMDYRLTDAVADPLGPADAWSTEALVRLPRCFLAYKPLVEATPRLKPPALIEDGVTFGSFNNTAKITPELVEAWASILARLPGSRLLLKSRAFADPATRGRYASLFAGHGIAEQRLVLLPQTASLEEHLQTYDQIDIALDTFPYNGTTTSCDALWMGVPVVTWAGPNHVSRVGASLLTQCGLGELVAADREGYIRAAVDLAQDLPRLSMLRRTMRKRLAGAPLLDHTGFARDVEAAFRGMWRAWLSRSAEP